MQALLPQRLGLRVLGIGSGFRVSGFGIRFRVPGFRFRVSDFGISGLGFRIPGLGFGVWGSGFRVSGFGLRVSSREFRVESLWLRTEGKLDVPGAREREDVLIPVSTAFRHSAGRKHMQYGMHYGRVIRKAGKILTPEFNRGEYA